MYLIFLLHLRFGLKKGSEAPTPANLRAFPSEDPPLRRLPPKVSLGSFPSDEFPYVKIPLRGISPY
jgi:hypothetical protein